MSSMFEQIRELENDQLLELQRLIHSAFTKPDPTSRNSRIAFIGLRGAGKTTIGSMLATRLGYPFVELDREVEREAGVPMSEIFEFYGQAGYRRQERASLERLFNTEPAFVVATGGSIVSEASTFELLLTGCFTIWLTATPAEHMARVIAQGDMRPMAGNPHAMSDLRKILAGREALHRRADVEISTSNLTAAETVDLVVAALPKNAAAEGNAP